MKIKLLKQRVPTVFGLLVLFFGMAVGIILLGRETSFLPRAAPESTPKNLKVTNVSHSSFSVSWVTDESAIGLLRYGTTANVDSTAVDDRDQLIGSSNAYVTHHVTVRGLEPDTKYFFKMGSGKQTQLYDNNGNPYEVTTASNIASVPAAETIYGTVLTKASTPAEGVIVYVTIEGGQALSSLVKSDGGWVVPLSTARTNNLISYLQYDPLETVIQIVVEGGRELTTQATTLTGNDQPVPTITLGQTHDFTNVATENQNTLENEEESAESGFSGVVKGESDINNQQQVGELQLLNPTREGEAINTLRPALHGKAPAGTKLNITVESPITYADNLIVNSDGSWSWSPPEDLEPGEHTVTLSYNDENGVQQTLQRRFLVLAAGEGGDPAITATPSGTPAPSPSPTPDSRVSQPSTQGGVPDSGILTPTLGFVIMGLMLIISGAAFLKRLKLLEING